MRTIFCGAALLAGAALAQAPVMTPGAFESRPALVLSNDRLALTVIPNGGALASVVLRDDPGQTNPYWNPVRLAREAGQKTGGGSTFGHFVCVDGFGPVSAEERAAGLPGHGEAHLQPWELVRSEKRGGAAEAVFTARLPLTQEVFTRTFRTVDGENVVYVASELESQVAFDRPACWAEHATIGAPFLEPGVTVVNMPAHRAHTRPHEPHSSGLPRRLASDRDFTWPLAPGLDGGAVDLTQSPAAGGTVDHSACLMDPGRTLAYVTALNPRRRLILGYIFKTAEYPWVQNWELYPANFKWARGMEFASQPFDVPRREAVTMNSLFGVPVYRWLPAKSKIGARFLLFYARAPEGMRQVDDVRLENGRITVEGSGKSLILAASLGL